MRSVEFKQESFEELSHWVVQDRKVYQRIVRLINEVRRTPFEGIGKPEPCSGCGFNSFADSINSTKTLKFYQFEGFSLKVRPWEALKFDS